MAVLGYQIVITMIFASFLSKVGAYFSFARWLLTSTGLVRYIHPSNEELRALSRQPRNHHHNANNGAELETFYVPRNSDVHLDTTPVTKHDVIQLRYYSEYHWLIDFSLCCILVYCTTEVCLYFFPAKVTSEINLSMVWCALLAGLAYKLLFSLTGLFFHGGETGEGALVSIMGLGYLLLAMLVLVVQEDTLESGLDEAYSSFNKSAAHFLADNALLDSSGPASKLVLKFFLALWCASIGAIFTFPGIRLSRMHWDALQHSGESGCLQVILHISFISPLLLTTLWIKPLSREYLTEKIFKGMNEPFITSEQFETARLLSVFLVIFLRMCLMPTYLQSYLNRAYYSAEALKQEAGRISNIDYQKTVARFFYYLCVVTLHYVTPMVMILSLTLMYKTMGGGSWCGLWAPLEYQPEIEVSSQNNFDQKQFIDDQDEQFSLAWESLKQVFTASVFKGLLGFSLWWCCLVWFSSSAIGFLYQSYFTKV